MTSTNHPAVDITPPESADGQSARLASERVPAFRRNHCPPSSECAVRELRSLLGALQVAKRTALQTAVRLFTTGLVLALMAGAAVKFKLFEGE